MSGCNDVDDDNDVMSAVMTDHVDIDFIDCWLPVLKFQCNCCWIICISENYTVVQVWSWSRKIESWIQAWLMSRTIKLLWKQYMWRSQCYILLAVVCSEQSPVPVLVRPPPADDVSYDVLPEELDESVEQQPLSVHAATTSRLGLVILC